MIRSGESRGRRHPQVGAAAMIPVLAIVLGLGIGWLDLHTTEVTVPIVGLLAAGLFCGTLQPRGAWRWALLLAVGVPAMQAVALWLDLDTAEPVRLDARPVLVVAAFALIGCYVGAGLRGVVGARDPD